MENLTQMLAYPLLGHTLGQILFALGATLLGFFALLLVRRRSADWLAKQSDGGTTSQTREILSILQARTAKLFLVVLSLWLGGLLLDLSIQSNAHLQRLLSVAVVIQGVLWTRALVDFFLTRPASSIDSQDPSRATTLRALSFALHTLLYVIAGVVILDNLGVNVTTLVAGLGVGGIAVALAAQNILGDIFASLTIVLDKPFVIGDAIAVGDLSGTVEHVGLKTTRVRSTSGEQLIFANADLLQSRIRNYKRMEQRRVVFVLSLSHETAREALERVPSLLTEVVQSVERVRLDRAHFTTLKAGSLDFEVVYFVLSSDYNLYMDIQQHINFEILRRFKQEKILFAVPSQTVRLFNGSESAPDPR